MTISRLGEYKNWGSINMLPSLLQVHGVAAQHSEEGCQLSQVTQCVLHLLICNAGDEIDVEQVPTTALNYSAIIHHCMS